MRSVLPKIRDDAGNRVSSRAIYILVPKSDLESSAQAYFMLKSLDSMLKPWPMAVSLVPSVVLILFVASFDPLGAFIFFCFCVFALSVFIPWTFVMRWWLKRLIRPHPFVCAACINNLTGLNSNIDGLTVCPECGAAWRLQTPKTEPA